VTVTGQAVEVTAENRDSQVKIYTQKHPHLEWFINSPNCALLIIHIEYYYLVERFQEVTELYIG
jgi:hypothetical protein